MKTFWRDVSLHAVVAGGVALLVGATSSLAVIFQAAQTLGATSAQIVSWMWALGLGIGLSSVALSMWFRQPFLVAWSTSAAAVIAAGAQGISLAEATGAFILSGVLIAILGFSGWFERIMDRIPRALASALLAGVLARFGMEAFVSAGHQPMLVIAMFVAYLLGCRWWPRMAVPLVLVVGIALAFGLGLVHHTGDLTLAWVKPEWVTPVWSWRGLMGVGLPVCIVTMASQNLPGIAALRGAGYDAPISPAIGVTGLVTALLAPFGCYSISLAAITAAICMGKEVDPDPGKRYTASTLAGIFYMIFGLLGVTVVGLLAALPQELIQAIAGLALLGTIGNSLSMALHDETQREPALVAFLVTLSGLTLAGIGSAFWGVVAGLLTWMCLRWRC